MSDARNRYDAASATHTILQELVAGEEWTIARTQHRFGLSYPQARSHLKFLEREYGLETFFDDDDRVKVWVWPRTRGQFLDEETS